MQGLRVYLFTLDFGLLHWQGQIMVIAFSTGWYFKYQGCYNQHA